MSNLTKDTEPLVSIISTLCNASRFINDTFNSVFKQNYENWE
jgi:glycosyltransferase involved in cell wall biosynthesis